VSEEQGATDTAAGSLSETYVCESANIDWVRRPP
jgi:hypothetical protein